MKQNRAKFLLSFCIIIFLGSLVIGIIDFNIYGNVIKNDIKNISKLTSTNIYSQISNELIKPLFVSLTMANDKFLKDWIEVENENETRKIADYLKGIKEKYNYSSTFFVSSKTNNYYNYNGVHKQVNTDDSHDIWYYDFISNDIQYDLDVDNDEASKNDLTVFVNCKIYGEQGDLLGVTGVGVKMEHISEMLRFYKDSLGIDAFLVDPNGLVQVHIDKKIIENENIFLDDNISKLKQEILAEKEKLQVFTPDSTFKGYYVITRYIKELDWYLVVKKDTLVLLTALQKQIINQIILAILVFIAVITININLLNRSQKELTKIATTDRLTGLCNRHTFDYRIQQTIRNAELNEIPLTLVIFDIDNFKEINDGYSHLVGDKLIKAIANNAKNFFQNEAVIARWGGDEFAIIFETTLSDVVIKMQKFRKSCEEQKDISQYNVTISVGIAEFKKGDNAESILNRADKALLFAKRNGKNQIKY